MNLRQIAAALPMHPARYLGVMAAPAVLGSGILVWALAEALGDLLTPETVAILYAVPVLILAAVVGYPVMNAYSNRSSINNSIHLFITHMGVLATSNMGRVDIFRALSRKKEYGALAAEVHKIAELVTRWNMGLSDACRFTAKRTASRIFSDFLERFAYSLDAGEEFEVFLRHEQAIVMEEYATLYRGRLYEVENLKGVFMSLVLALVFMIIFLLILPILVGMSPGPLVVGSLFAVATVEIFFVWLAKSKSPLDPLWHQEIGATRARPIVMRTLPFSILGVLAVTGLVLYFLDLPPALVIALGVTPLLITGFAVGREEARLRRRDENFGAFIRSLGASTANRGGAVREVLRTLRDHDFGPLTDDIRALHHRLNLQVDDKAAWHMFSTETGSNLIDKFSAMFVEGVKAGGKPDAIGQILSENFIRMVGLRAHRAQIAGSFRGLLYGLAAGVALALAIGYGVLRMVVSIFETISVPSDTLFINPATITEIPLTMISFVILCVILVHTVISSLLVRIAMGGNHFAGWVDFVGMQWVASISTVIAGAALETLLGAGTA